MELKLINQKNKKSIKLGRVFLEDDTTPTGGIGHQGETLAEFIESFEELSELAQKNSLSLDYLNEVLTQNGIKTIFPLLNYTRTAFNIGIA